MYSTDGVLVQKYVHIVLVPICFIFFFSFSFSFHYCLLFRIMQLCTACSCVQYLICAQTVNVLHSHFLNKLQRINCRYVQFIQEIIVRRWLCQNLLVEWHVEGNFQYLFFFSFFLIEWNAEKLFSASWKCDGKLSNETRRRHFKNETSNIDIQL